MRDWLYVEDHVRAIEKVLLKGEPREIYNISAGEEKTNIEVVRTILRLMDKGEEFIEFVEDRPGHDLRYSLDSWKITRDLKWRPKYTFKEGIRKTVNWYLENEDWWRPLVNDKVLHQRPGSWGGGNMPFEFKRLEIPDVILIKPRVFEDERGFFMETYKNQILRKPGSGGGVHPGQSFKVQVRRFKGITLSERALRSGKDSPLYSRSNL